MTEGMTLCSSMRSASREVKIQKFRKWREYFGATWVGSPVTCHLHPPALCLSAGMMGLFLASATLLRDAAEFATATRHASVHAGTLSAGGISECLWKTQRTLAGIVRIVQMPRAPFTAPSAITAGPLQPLRRGRCPDSAASSLVPVASRFRVSAITLPRTLHTRC